MTTQPRFIRLAAEDNVVVAVDMIDAGKRVDGVTAAARVMKGHKMATKPLAEGEPIVKYGQIIGFATEADLRPGDCASTPTTAPWRAFERDYAFCARCPADGPHARPRSATFDGLSPRRRPGGDTQLYRHRHHGELLGRDQPHDRAVQARAAARAVSQHRRCRAADAWRRLWHGGLEASRCEVLRRTLAGYTRHPNMAAVVVLGLGCEANQIAGLMSAEGAEGRPEADPRWPSRTKAASRRAVDARRLDSCKELLPEANNVAARADPSQRTDPRAAVRWLGRLFRHHRPTRHWGRRSTCWCVMAARRCLSETPEIYGAEHLLDAPRRQPRGRREDRASHQMVGRLHVPRTGGEMNNNPSPGNKAGGLTTILEKSLGAAAKGGIDRRSVGVYRLCRADRPRTGFVYMDTPGYDPVSATGQVAGGANVLCFTTGRGSRLRLQTYPVTQACHELGHLSHA